MRTFIANHAASFFFGFMHILVLMVVASFVGIVPALILAAVAGGLAFGSVIVNYTVLATR